MGPVLVEVVDGQVRLVHHEMYAAHVVVEPEQGALAEREPQTTSVQTIAGRRQRGASIILSRMEICGHVVLDLIIA